MESYLGADLDTMALLLIQLVSGHDVAGPSAHPERPPGTTQHSPLVACWCSVKRNGDAPTTAWGGGGWGQCPVRVSPPDVELVLPGQTCRPGHHSRSRHVLGRPGRPGLHPSPGPMGRRCSLRGGGRTTRGPGKYVGRYRGQALSPIGQRAPSRPAVQLFSMGQTDGIPMKGWMDTAAIAPRAIRLGGQ